MGTRIGCCLPGASFMPEGIAAVESSVDILLDGYRAVMEAGYDYAECGVGMLMKLTEEEFEELVAKKEAGLFGLEACNSFIPGDFHVAVASELPALTDYVEEAMRRMHLLGVQVVVFGSGAARRMPEKDAPAEIAAIEAFLRMCEPKAEHYGITVVIEPLNKNETNVFNSVSEGASMVRKLQLPHVMLLADCFHVYKESENLICLEENADLLRHIHIAECPARVCPGETASDFLCAFGEHLKGAQYNGRVSIECSFGDFVKEIGAAYPLMRKLFC